MITTCNRHASFVAILSSLSLLLIGARCSSRDFNISVADCCSRVSGSCYDSCVTISVLDFGTDEGKDQIDNVLRDCGPRRAKFWRCINSTLREMKDVFDHRPCCSLPTSKSCRLTCLKAESRSDISQSCRMTDETKFYKCLKQQHAGDDCCKTARTRSCYRACLKVINNRVMESQQTREFRDALSQINEQGRRKRYHRKRKKMSAQRDEIVGYLNHNSYPRSDTDNWNEFTNLNKVCKERSPDVLKCVDVHLSQTSEKSPSNADTRCCRQAASRECNQVCQDIINSFNDDEQELIDRLSGSICGPPSPVDPMWQCLLLNAKPLSSLQHSNRNKAAHEMDSAKLQCCYRAVSQTCQQLCFKTYSQGWRRSWKEFNKLCQYQALESRMLNCLADVDEPCNQGCSSLQYCTNFNNHPGGLFRSCNAHSDYAAQKEEFLWSKMGFIRLPYLDIPVLDIKKCEPESWKALACILHIKPCTQRLHANVICRSDCLRIMNKCLDKERVPMGQTPESLCHLLSPTDNECIPLAYYSDYQRNKMDDSFAENNLMPCSSQGRKEWPCGKSGVCVVNNRQSVNSYKCVPGCRLGQISSLIAVENTLVRIPSMPYSKGCEKFCTCNGKTGAMDKCTDLPCNEVLQQNCRHKGSSIAHHTQFMDGCKICSCIYGKIVCSEATCSLPANFQKEHQTMTAVLASNTTGKTCAECPVHYSPVCGSNGKTYTNDCRHNLCRRNTSSDVLAESYKNGECYLFDPCHPNPCLNKSHKCVSRTKICLTHGECPQYECVSSSKAGCHANVGGHLGPVCDIQGDEYSNICVLLAERKHYAYWGRCQKNCDRFSGLVCGIDGETYNNECEATNRNVLTDYHGPCRTLGPEIGKSVKMCDTLVSCSKHSSRNKNHRSCQTMVIPPGACCPVCGTVLRLLYSQKMLKQITEVTGSILITVQDVVQKLQTRINVVNCRVFGYLDTYGDIIIVVTADNDSISLISELCQTEGKKLLSQLQNRSPLMASDAVLSSIVAAIPADVVVVSGTTLLNSLSFNLCMISSVWYLTMLI